MAKWGMFGFDADVSTTVKNVDDLTNAVRERYAGKRKTPPGAEKCLNSFEDVLKMFVYVDGLGHEVCRVRVSNADVRDSLLSDIKKLFDDNSSTIDFGLYFSCHGSGEGNLCIGDPSESLHPCVVFNTWMYRSGANSRCTLVFCGVIRKFRLILA